MFVGGSGSEIVEVFGALAPSIRSDEVKIFKFQRYDNFRTAFLQDDRLEANRLDLERHGFSADLATHDLGPGKMVVPSHLAWSTLLALCTRRRAHGAQLQYGGVGVREVVVSREFESVVLEVARRASTRPPRVVLHPEVLELPRVLGVGQAATWATQSTSPEANPRTRRSPAWDAAA